MCISIHVLEVLLEDPRYYDKMLSMTYTHCDNRVI